MSFLNECYNKYTYSIFYIKYQGNRASSENTV